MSLEFGYIAHGFFTPLNWVYIGLRFVNINLLGVWPFLCVSVLNSETWKRNQPNQETSFWFPLPFTMVHQFPTPCATTPKKHWANTYLGNLIQKLGGCQNDHFREALSICMRSTIHTWTCFSWSVSPATHKPLETHSTTVHSSTPAGLLRPQHSSIDSWALACRCTAPSLIFDDGHAGM